MKAARNAGAVTSFDLNFREKLWSIWGGQQKAVEVVARIVENVDVLIGNEEDLQKGLGIPGPEVGARSKLDPSAFFGMMGSVVKKHPQIKAVATTLREVHSTNRHSWGAVAWVTEHHVSPTCELDIFDRVGGGDGFASGFIYGLLAGEHPEDAVKLGWAHGALLTTFPGDTTMATVDQVRACNRRIGTHSGSRCELGGISPLSPDGRPNRDRATAAENMIRPSQLCHCCSHGPQVLTRSGTIDSFQESSTKAQHRGKHADQSSAGNESRRDEGSLLVTRLIQRFVFG